MAPEGSVRTTLQKATTKATCAGPGYAATQLRKQKAESCWVGNSIELWSHHDPLQDGDNPCSFTANHGELRCVGQAVIPFGSTPKQLLCAKSIAGGDNDP